MKLINLTPHDVTVRLPSGEDVVFPKSGLLARVDMEDTMSVPIDIDGSAVPTKFVEYGIAELPSDTELCSAIGPNDFIDGYIVSTMFADAYERSGQAGPLFVPDSGPTAIRESGQIKAVRALIRR